MGRALNRERRGPSPAVKPATRSIADTQRYAIVGVAHV